MAAPHVTGAAALVWSKDPGMNNSQVRAALREIAAQKGTTSQYGYGVIDLSSIIPVPESVPVPVNPEPAAAFDLQITLTVGSKETLVNGKTQIIDAEPFIDTVANRTMVPIRFISENMGAKVGWSQDERIVTIKSNNQEIKITIGSRIAYVNGQQRTLDVSPVVVSGRTFVPIRFVSENLGANVKWESTARKVIIKK
jgi:hypothetical protein